MYFKLIKYISMFIPSTETCTNKNFNLDHTYFTEICKEFKKTIK